MAYSRGRCLLKPLLKKKGWTQSELARRSGYHPRMISYYANNEKPMPAEVMKTISVLLDCNMEDLYEWVWVDNADD